MKINVGQSIVEYLFSRRTVSIPGLGSFRLQSDERSFQLGDSTIQPPRKRIEFHDEIEQDENLRQYIQAKYDVGKKKADDAISVFSKRILNRLLNLDSALIPGLGTLKKGDGSGLTFEPESPVRAPDNYSLPTVFIEPIEHTSETKEAVAVTQSITPPVSVAKESAFSWRDWLGPLLLLLLLVAIIATLAWWFGNSRTNAAGATEGAQIERTVQPPSEDQALNPTTTDEERNTDGAQADVSADGQSKNNTHDTSNDDSGEDSSDDIVSDGASDGSASDETSDGITSAGTSDSGTFGEASEHPTEVGAAAGTDEEVSTSTALSDSDTAFDHPNLAKYKDILTEEALEVGCVIVVGSFKKARNVIKMRDRIIRAGLTPFTETYGEFTRVGILFTCAEHDLRGYIDTIRRNFDTYAWYLIPEFEVPRG